MTEDAGPVDLAGVNPFPPAAVATAATRAWVSIPTAAWDEAMADVTEYVHSSGQASPHGRTVAIVGDFGTGKTHLALEMLRKLEDLTGETATRLYLDAPGESFVSLYRDRFLPRIDRIDLRSRVLEYYADVIAEELQDSEIAAGVVRALREGAVQPEQVVDHFALAPTRLRKRLSDRLQEVTQEEQFATALTLLIRPEYEAAVWQWLNTATPDSALMERGVTKTIESDVDALEAIGVFALIYGHRGRRFAVVLDELEKILVPLTELEGSGDVILSLKRLMQIFMRTGSLLILCGLPDYFDLLPEDARQRISDVIEPTRLSGADTRRYIEESQARVFGAPRLKPFSDESAGYIASIAGGNPRQVVRLCYRSYRTATDRGVPVTRALVREVAKEQFETATVEDVVRDVTEMLDRHGWLFERNKQLGRAKTAKVDFWIHLGQAETGCAVVITDSLLDKGEADRLLARLATILKGTGATGVSQVLTVVNGRVGDEAGSILSTSDFRLFEYGTPDFAGDLENVLSGVFERHERSRHGVSLDSISQRIEQLGRQMLNLDRSIDELARTVSRQDLSVAAERGLRRLFRGIGGAPEDAIPDDFPGVRRTFWEARADIRELLSGDTITGISRREMERDLRGVSLEIDRFEEDLGVALVSTLRKGDLPSGAFFGDAESRLRSALDEFGREMGMKGSSLHISAVATFLENFTDFVRKVFDALQEDFRRVDRLP